MAGIFNSAIFNNAIFNVGVESARNFSLRNWRKWIKDEKEVQQIAVEVIEAVAQRQAQTLVSDEQQRFDELSRELELTGIAWEARYLEALNALREQLIQAEIEKRLRIRQMNEQTLIAMLLFT